MPDQSEVDSLRQTIKDRESHFRLNWFRDLLSGRLSLGDTFWIGNFGVALVFVPVGFMVIFVSTTLFGKIGGAVVLGLFYAFVAAYLILLTRAVFVASRRAPNAGGWRWVGVAYTAVNALLVGVLAVFI